MSKFLIDTNIAIYLANNEFKYYNFIKSLEGTLLISVITYIEIMIGARGSEILDFVDRFDILGVNKEIGYLTAKYLRLKKSKGLRNNNSSDIIIGATAITNHLPLITNNPKDFKIFDNLEIITP